MKERFNLRHTLLSEKSGADLVGLLLVPLLGSSLGVRLHIKVPSIQLDDVSILNVRQDLGDGFVGVALRQEHSRLTGQLLYLRSS